MVNFRLPRLRLLPTSSDESRLLFLVISVVVAYWLFLTPFPGNDTWSYVDSNLHTVEQNYLRGKNYYQNRVLHQSKTHLGAVTEYKRRYGKNPPCGFEKWFKLAKSWNSTFIDDFDDIQSQLEPFEDYLKQHCHQEEWEEEKCTNQKLVQLCFRNGKMKLCGRRNDTFSQGIKAMVSKFEKNMPDFCVFLNPLDEPRLIIPPPIDTDILDLLRRKKDRLKPSQFTPRCPSIHFVNLPHQNIWSDATMFCTEDSPLRSISDHHDRELSSVAKFNAASLHANRDVCMLHEEPYHGTIQSPEEMSLTHDIVPILSHGKLSTFGDLLYPSPYRVARDQKRYQSKTDKVKWALKKSALYWRGSTTGGHAHQMNWERLHRQHIVRTLRDSSDIAIDVAFTDIVQCERTACDSQRSSLPMKDANSTERWNYKYLLDMDGNGPSEQFFDLIRSNSVIVRYSLIKEWHDQRLIPWYHYIPLSAGMEEVEGLISYFSTNEGDEVARKAADAGREFAHQNLRVEDMSLYFYRLLLEMARYQPCKRGS